MPPILAEEPPKPSESNDEDEMEIAIEIDMEGNNDDDEEDMASRNTEDDFEEAQGKCFKSTSRNSTLLLHTYKACNRARIYYMNFLPFQSSPLLISNWTS